MDLKPKVFVGTCLITLALHGNVSLKGRRSVLNRIKSRVKNRFNVSIAEVGNTNNLKKAVLGLCSVSNDRVYLEGQIAKVINFIAGISDASIADVQTMLELKGEEDHVFL